MRPDLLITQAMAKSCVTALEANFTVHTLVGAPDPEAVIAAVGTDIRAIAGGRVSAAMMEKLPKLEIIANAGVGYDSIDVTAAKSCNVRVTNTPGVLNDAVAELTIGLMIALARKIPQADRFVRDGKWADGAYRLAGELKGKTVGILGLGRIGKEIAVRAQAMKMDVVYFGRSQHADVDYRYYDDLMAMARDVDWLVVIAPGGKATDKIVSRDVMAALGPRGALVNVARGSLVDQEAMVEMLADGSLGAAALDVFEGEPAVPEALLGLDTVVLSPHQGSKTSETRDAMGALVVANLLAHFAGKPLLTPVA